MATFEYNSQRPNLIIAEYGRHIQKMVEYVKAIEDDKERQTTAEAVIQLMNQMVPQGKQEEDYIDKLWKHFFRIGKYDVDVTPPSGKRPEPNLSRMDLSDMPYTQSNLKFRHYGKNVMTMIEKAKGMEDGPVKEGFIHTIASYMKLAYKNWNKDHYVSDDNIVSDIDLLSNGELSVADGSNLDLLGKSAKNIPNGQHPSSNRKRKGKRMHKRRKSRY